MMCIMSENSKMTKCKGTNIIISDIMVFGREVWIILLPSSMKLHEKHQEWYLMV